MPEVRHIVLDHREGSRSKSVDSLLYFDRDAMAKMIYPQLSYTVQGSFLDVYRDLHHLELSEQGWETALMIALQERGLDAQRQVEFALHYKGQRVGRFFIDIIVEDKIALELKCRDELLPIDQGQLLAYLKVSGLELGILVNFGGERLEYKRVPNFLEERSHDYKPPEIPQGADYLLFPDLTAQLRAALYEAYAELGSGFMHMHYRRAVQIELQHHGIPFDLKKEIELHYHSQTIEKRDTRLLVIEDKVLLIVLAVQAITPALKNRLGQYLKLLGLELGMIANFHAPRVQIETVRMPGK